MLSQVEKVMAFTINDIDINRYNSISKCIMEKEK